MVNTLSHNYLENIASKIVIGEPLPEKNLFNIDELFSNHHSKISTNGKYYRYFTVDQMNSRMNKYHSLVSLWQPLMEIASPIFNNEDSFISLFDKAGYIISSPDKKSIGVRCPAFSSDNTLSQTNVPRETHVYFCQNADVVSIDTFNNDNFQLIVDYSLSKRYLNSVIFPILGEKKDSIGFVGAGVFDGELTKEIRVISYLIATALQMSYNQIQFNKKHFASLLNGIPICAMLLDEYARIIHMNEQCTALLGNKEVKGFIHGNFNNFKRHLQLHKYIKDIMSFPEKFSIITTDNQVIPCILQNQHVVPFGKSKQLLVLLKGEQKTFKNQGTLSNTSTDSSTLNRLIGTSLAITRIKHLVKKVATTPSSVLIEGESGTGKELVAKAIHEEGKQHGPFIPINCGAFSKELLQSELFGYEDGAFTGAKKGGMYGKFEIADGGTVFLDEIGEMPISMQVSLLRFLQDKTVVRVGGSKPKKVNVKIIAATNRKLISEVEQGRFRKDLYYRLNIINIKMPPLRDRPEDIKPIANHILIKLCEEFGIQQLKISPKVMDILTNYDWPGNVRELHNVIENLIVVCEGEEITTDYLPPHLEQAEVLKNANVGTLEFMEKTAIINALRQFSGNLSQTALSLGISRPTLYRKMKNFGL